VPVLHIERIPLHVGLGVLVVSLAMSLPFIGWLVAALVVRFGGGAMILERRTVASAV
jgi:hypothetical protein